MPAPQEEEPNLENEEEKFENSSSDASGDTIDQIEVLNNTIGANSAQPVRQLVLSGIVYFTCIIMFHKIYN